MHPPGPYWPRARLEPPDVGSRPSARVCGRDVGGVHPADLEQYSFHGLRDGVLRRRAFERSTRLSACDLEPQRDDDQDTYQRVSADAEVGESDAGGR